MLRRAEKFDVNVIGITLSKNQSAHSRKMLAGIPTNRTVEIRMQGWEEFDDKVDRIVSIGAFEAFKSSGIPRSSPRPIACCPTTAACLLHTILAHNQAFSATTASRSPSAI